MKRSIISVIVMLIFICIFMTACGSEPDSSNLDTSSSSKASSSSILEGFEIKEDGEVCLTKSSREMYDLYTKDDETFVKYFIFCRKLREDNDQLAEANDDYTAEEKISEFYSEDEEISSDARSRMMIYDIQGVIIDIEADYYKYYYE